VIQGEGAQGNLLSVRLDGDHRDDRRPEETGPPHAAILADSWDSCQGGNWSRG